MAIQQRAEATRRALIEGAATGFEKFGYGSSSLSAILAYAGLSKGALYFHFRTKEELAAAVIEAQHDMAMAGIRSVLEHTPSPMEAIVAMSRDMARQIVEEPIVRAGMRLTLEIGTAGGAVSGPYADWIAAVREQAVRAIASKEMIASIDPDMVARFVVSAFTGVQVVSETMTGRTDLYRRVREMWILILPALVPPRRLPYLRDLASSPWPSESPAFAT